MLPDSPSFSVTTPSKKPVSAWKVFGILAVGLGVPVAVGIAGMDTLDELTDTNRKMQEREALRLAQQSKQYTVQIPPGLMNDDADWSTAAGIAAGTGIQFSSEELVNPDTVLFSGVIKRGNEVRPFDFKVADVEKLGPAMAWAQQYFALSQGTPEPPANSMTETVKRRRGEAPSEPTR